MNRIKYDSDSMKLITLFESMTGAKLKDCIADGKLIFIIEEGQMGRAIGRNGSNIKRVENAFKKKIKLVEFSGNPLQFIRNMIHPIIASDITEENGTITIHGRDTSARAALIGRERQNINQVSDIARRYFDIKEIKVV